MSQNIIFPNNRDSFRIMILSDIQEGRALSDNYRKMLIKAINHEKPHLILLLGDMIFGPVLLSTKKVEQVICSITGLLDTVQIPFTFIFGNHDLDSFVSSEKQIQMYQTSEYCITPDFDNRTCKQAYSLDVTAPEGNKLFSLLCFDSGATRLTRYGISYKGPDAGADKWTENVIKTTSVPCFVFQHVPVFSIYRLLKASDKQTEGSVKGHGMFRGKWFTKATGTEGILGESPCPEWQKEDRQFSVWCSNHRIKAAVFGHDHKNAFSGTINDITLFQSPCAGLNCYGNDDTRGIRILDINRNGNYTSHISFLSQYSNEK